MNQEPLRYFTAQYVLVDDRFLAGQTLAVDEDGRIASVGPAPSGASVDDLGEVAIVPGLVNAHSHAFQRAIRGRTEWIDPERPDDDFWTWRDRMYAAATSFTPEDVFAVARWAFLEMALSGVTTVGEFHYLHHQPDGTPYEDPNEIAHRVIAAAREIGIRISLLRVAYRRAGPDRDLAGEQARFADEDDDAYLARVEALRDEYADSEDVSIGIAPHSIRAVGADTLRVVSNASVLWDTPLHIHACEQPREIRESIAEYGMNPVEVFADLGMLDERLTIVHATHVTDGELDLMGESRPTVCACPTTERNLGDGFLPARELVERDVPICLGSDSHTNIDLWQDARCVEYHERLNYEQRNVLAASAARNPKLGVPHRIETANVLWPMLAEHGARALRMPVGALEPGNYADFVALDLTHPTLVGATADTLLTDVCLSMSADAVRDVYVGGEGIIGERDHPRYAAAMTAFGSVATEL